MTSRYHDTGTDGDDATAVRIGHDVAVTDRQERDDDHPHRVEHALVLSVVEADNTHGADCIGCCKA